MGSPPVTTVFGRDIPGCSGREPASTTFTGGPMGTQSAAALTETWDDRAYSRCLDPQPAGPLPAAQRRLHDGYQYRGWRCFQIVERDCPSLLLSPHGAQPEVGH